MAARVMEIPFGQGWCGFLGERSMNLAARLELSGADVMPLGGGEVAVAEQRRGEGAASADERLARLVAAQAAEAVRVDLHTEETVGDEDDPAIDGMRRQWLALDPSQSRLLSPTGRKLGRTRSR